jgi:hypothetical protein
MIGRIGNVAERVRGTWGITQRNGAFACHWTFCSPQTGCVFMRDEDITGMFRPLISTFISSARCLVFASVRGADR